MGRQIYFVGYWNNQNFVIEKGKLMVNIGIANLALTKTLKNTTTPQVEKNRTTTKHTATKTKNILTNTVIPTITPKKNYTESGTEQNTKQI
jgi:hypothetical protein